VPQLDQAVADAFDTKALELILLPTEKCQLRCTYCYEDFALGKMPADIVVGIKRLVAMRMPDLRRFRLSWFGGEPLLARGIVLDVSHHCRMLAAEHGVAFHGSMTTNGMLLDQKMLRSLNEAGVNDFQITLDGAPQFHNRTRITLHGGPTFQRIWDNLLAIRESELKLTVVLRLHMSPSNRDGRHTRGSLSSSLRARSAAL